MINKKIYKLHNQIKHYEWGSSKVMPDFFGIKNTEKVPYAEMWMGTHESAPSQAEYFISDSKAGAVKVPLKEISGDIPILLKLIAVEKPLSIQAHPDKEKAHEGFYMEEAAGVDLRSPMRNYKDPNHKPELLYALSNFSFMAGFRQIEQIKNILDEFLSGLPQLKEIISPLQRSLNTGSLAVFLRILFNLSKLEKEYISQIISNTNIVSKEKIISREMWELMKNFACQYPEDPAIISPLYLNYLTLQPGQAVYLPPGILHSYISGFGIELMSSSDNVLRGGLTPKYIDIPELMNILNFKPYNPNIFSDFISSYFCYEDDDFSLGIMHGNGQEKLFPGKGPAVCLVTEGELIAEGISFKKGESFFIPKNNNKLIFNGSFTAFIASYPMVK